MEHKIEYGNNSIDGLIGEERIRRRPASTLGSSGLDGARHGVVEIYGNALDEMPYAVIRRLDVKYYKDGSVSIRDYGRGVPMGWNDKDAIKNWNWFAIFTDLYAGGKYGKNQEQLRKQNWSCFDAKDYNYLYSVGLNGLGAASTQYTSEFFEVKSYRDGKCTSRQFSKGRPLVNGKPFNMFAKDLTLDDIKAIPEEISDTDEPNGTFIRWKPDKEVFSDINIGGDWLYSVCKDISGIANVELHFEDENSDTKVIIPAGDITNVLVEHSGKALELDDDGNPIVFTCSNMTHGNTLVENEPFIYVCECKVAIGLTDRTVDYACYHNSVAMRSGIQYSAIKDAIESFIKDKIRGLGIKYDYRDVEGMFGVIVSSYSNYASFRGQTKDGVDDTFIYTTIRDAILDKLNIEYGKGTTAIVDIVSKVVENANNRQALVEYSKALEQNKKIVREKAPEKFVSCEAYEKKRYDEVELWITEGDSAGGSVKNARSRVYQAIFPIRGKGLNVLKSSLDKILKNKEIREIFSILGTGMDISIKGCESTFDMSKLKVGKIIIATDADEDGYQIRVLLFLTFYKLAPELLRAGKIFIAETPRFRINFTDGTYVYAKNDAERDKIMASDSARIKSISRYKGLGEVNADILRETTVHPDTRNLVPLTCDFDNELERDLIDALFGADKYKQRKNIISTALNYSIDDIVDDEDILLIEEQEEDIEEEEEVV